MKHFAFIASSSSHTSSGVCCYSHLTDEEPGPWIDDIIFLSRADTAEEAGVNPIASHWKGRAYFCSWL